MRVILRAKDKKKITSMYESGMSMQKIGEALGVSKTYIFSFMKKHNIKVRNQTHKKVILDKEKIATLYESGMSQGQIAKVFGASRYQIHWFMKKHDIKARNGKMTEVTICTNCIKY